MLNTLKTKLVTPKLYFCKKSILRRILLRNGEIISKKRYIFTHGTTNYCGVKIGFLGNKNFKWKRLSTDTNHRIIIAKSQNDDEILVLINPFSSNTDEQHIKTLCDLDQFLGEFSLDSYKRLIFPGDFYLRFNSSLDTSRCNIS